MDKLVSQLPSLAPRWQDEAIHKPWHGMPECLTHTKSICLKKDRSCVVNSFSLAEVICDTLVLTLKQRHYNQQVQVVQIIG